MTWNHRILRRTNGDLEIVEVYYTDDGKLWCWGSAAVYASAEEGTASLARQVLWYRKALGQPIVEESAFGAMCGTCADDRYLYDPTKDEGKEYTNCPSCNLAVPAGPVPSIEKDGQRGSNLSIVDRDA